MDRQTERQAGRQADRQTFRQQDDNATSQQNNKTRKQQDSTTIKHSNTTEHQHKWKTKQSPWPHPFLEQKIKKPETPNQANLSLTADWGKESRTCWATRMMKLCVVPGLFSKHLTLWQWSLACWNMPCYWVDIHGPMDEFAFEHDDFPCRWRKPILILFVHLFCGVGAWEAKHNFLWFQLYCFSGPSCLPGIMKQNWLVLCWGRVAEPPEDPGEVSCHRV